MIEGDMQHNVKAKPLSKLTNIDLLPAEKKALYQREKRAEEKKAFRQELGNILGKEFLEMANELMKYGLSTFRDFVDRDTFQAFIDAYDIKIADKSESAKSSAFGFTFHNFQSDKDFLVNTTFKESFSHPLLIALVAYAMGGPIRLVDVRGKNAEPGLTMVRDNGPHVDDNPFNDEWKLLITWMVDHPSGKSFNRGPQGQCFVSVPGTEKLVRRDATEYGANFKNPFELLELLKEQAAVSKLFFMEAKDERPLFSLFEASHQMHHRKRSPDEAARGCVIFAYHLVDVESRPGAYFKDDTGISDPLDRFVMCGELSEEKISEVNKHFITIIKDKQIEIQDKLREIASRKVMIPATEKMMTPEQLIKYFKLLIHTYKTEFLQSKSELRIQPEDLIAPDKVRQKLREQIGETDKHYDLDLIIYPDKREQIRKVPRTALRESSSEKIRRAHFDKLKIPETKQEPFKPGELQNYVNKFMPYAEKLGIDIKKMLIESSVSALALIKDLDDTASHPDIDSRCKSLPSYEKSLIELYQLTKDLGEALTRCDHVKSLRAHAYFLYLVYDKMISFVKEDILRSEIEKNAEALLQYYFNLVIKDDLTYKLSIKKMDIQDIELTEKLANILVNDHGVVQKLSETEFYQKTMAKTEVKVSEHTVFFTTREEEKESNKITFYESALAEAMLIEASHNDKIKDHLSTAANALNEKVMKPLINILFSLLEDKRSFDELPVHLRNTLNYFINENSTQANQRLGIFRNKSPDEIKKSPEMIKKLITQIQSNLLNAKATKTVDEIDRVVKAINEVACCYVDHFPLSEKSANYAIIAANVMPSSEESLARVKPEELGKPKLLSLATGTERKNVVLAEHAPQSAFIAGKSMFSMVDLISRAKIEHAKLKRLYDVFSELKDQCEKEPGNELLRKEFEIARNTYMEQKSFIKAKNIPVPGETRLSSIERLAHTSFPASGLIAGVSTTESRTLIALYDLGVFGRDEQFNFDKERMISNCLQACLMHGGHHSFLELAEPHNRLLDAIAIDALEKGNMNIVARCEQEQVPVMDLSLEDYPRIFHPDYREAVSVKATEQIEASHRLSL